MDINKSKINVYIMTLYIFQFGLLQPIVSIVNSQLPIAVFTLLLAIIMILNNNFKIKKYVVVTFAILSIYFLFNILLYNNETIMIFIEFLLKSFSAFLIGSLDVDGEELYGLFLKVAIMNFIVLLIYPILGYSDTMNYMRFGYSMLPSTIMFFYAALNEKKNKLFWKIIALISLVLILIYGSRGPLGVILILGALVLIFQKNTSRIKKSIIVILSCIGIYLIKRYNLLIKLLDYIYFNLGIQTYSLAKYRMMINQGISESSSGRDKIYISIWELIKQKPFIGHGVGILQLTSGYTAHNIFLQILVESGILGFVVWIFVWIYCLNKYNKMSKSNEYGLFRVVTLIVSIAIGRLLISSDMWLRPEYWFAISMLINFKWELKCLQKNN